MRRMVCTRRAPRRSSKKVPPSATLPPSRFKTTSAKFGPKNTTYYPCSTVASKSTVLLTLLLWERICFSLRRSSCLQLASAPKVKADSVEQETVTRPICIHTPPCLLRCCKPICSFLTRFCRLVRVATRLKSGLCSKILSIFSWMRLWPRKLWISNSRESDNCLSAKKVCSA